MTTSTDTWIVFTAGSYNTAQTQWCEPNGGPSAVIHERLFRSIFDAAGDETIDTTGDIDPEVLFELVDLGPRGAEEATAGLRLICRWARRRNLRVGFGTEQQATVR